MAYNRPTSWISDTLTRLDKEPFSCSILCGKKHHKGDSVVFAYNSGFFKYKEKDPFDGIDGVNKIIPSNYTRRIEAQLGAFTVHENPRDPLEDIAPPRSLHKIVIENSFRNDFKDILSGYGLNRATLFPDMDGISDYINSYLSGF